MNTVVQTLAQIISSNAIVPWEKLDPTLQSQIRQAIAPTSAVECVIYPSSQDELAEVVACIATNRWRVLVCGNGSKLHWGGLANGVQLVLSTAGLNKLVEHAIGDMTVTVEAGMKVADLQAILANERQFLPVDPAYSDQATVGGMIATADTGALRQRYGGIRDLLIGISLVRTDGKVAKAGGRVVKNVAGYDLMKLFTGSYGTLGVISQATFRLYPLLADSRTVVLTGAIDSIAQVTATLLSSGLSPTAVELVAAPTIASLEVGRDMGLIVRFQSIEVSVQKQAEHLIEAGQILGLQCAMLANQDEVSLWQRFRELMDTRPEEPQITCKIGVLPSNAAEMLDQFSRFAPSMQIGVIHAGSGLGILRFPSLSLAALNQMRELCQAQRGFLTVLEAPIALKQQALKQQFDIWGYPGNALSVMQSIKQQFDPHNLFSPDRFIRGI